MREKIEERKNISKELKMKALAKSNGRCCHCGKELTEKTATIEHFIPLSKGGKNIPINLICSCDDCNRSKDNFIVRPHEYCKFVNGPTLIELNSLYEAYLSDSQWLTAKNYAKEDYFTIQYMIPLKSMQGNKSKTPKDYRCVTMFAATAVVKKASYEDLKEVEDFTLKYHDKYGLGSEDVSQTISDIFKTGAIYLLYKQNALTAVLPIRTVKKTVNNRQIYTPVISGIPCLYPSDNNMSLIHKAINSIFVDIANLNNCAITFNVIAPLADILLSDYCKISGNPIGGDNEWIEYTFVYNHDEKGELSDKKVMKLLIKTSEFLQKTMKLIPLKSKEEINRRQSYHRKAVNEYKAKKIRIRESARFVDDFVEDYDD